MKKKRRHKKAAENPKAKGKSDKPPDGWRPIFRGAWLELSAHSWLQNIAIGLALLLISPLIAVMLMNSRKGIIIGFGIGVTILVWVGVFVLVRQIQPAPIKPPITPSAATSETPNEPPKTLHEFFRNDFGRFLSLDGAQHAKMKTGETVDVETRIFFDFDAKSAFLGFYIPGSQSTYILCEYLASEGYKQILETRNNGVTVEGGMPFTRPANTKDFKFTGTIFIYHELPLLNSEIESLIPKFKKHNLMVEFRGPQYVFSMNNPPATPLRFPNKS